MAIYIQILGMTFSTEKWNQSDGRWAQVEQGFSSFFAIFDDFSKFRCSAFDMLHFE